MSVGSDGDIQSLVARGQRRRIPPSAVLVKDVLHLINAPELQSVPEIDVQVRHHQPICKPAALSRLRVAVTGRTMAEWLDDPHMEQAISQLDPERSERGDFLHARATLALSKTVPMPVSGPTIDDAATRLGVLLAQKPPCAGLRVRTVHGRPEDGWKPLHRIYLSSDGTSGDLDELLDVEAVGHEVVTRTAVRRAILRQQHRCIELPREGEQLPLILSTDAEAAQDVDVWWDLVEASTALLADGADAFMARRTEWHKDDVSGLIALNHDVRQELSVAVSIQTWSEADRLLALSWWTLRTALANGAACSLHDGALICALPGTGLYADIRVEEDATAGPPSGLVDAWLSVACERDGDFLTPSSYKWHIVRELVEVQYANSYSTQIGPRMPTLTLRGKGIIARVRYGGSGLLLVGSSPEIVLDVGAQDRYDWQTAADSD